ncbi:hypothetical protein ACIPY2_08585 [Paenarthrobacter sp. NPDC089675]|uniref:hypothetical protein n=1 Tax=Paenarthrobacter sp. NPDC089675 TaxID=3364376 RepID=UPI00382EC9BF
MTSQHPYSSSLRSGMETEAQASAHVFAELLATVNVRALQNTNADFTALERVKGEMSTAVILADVRGDR